MGIALKKTELSWDYNEYNEQLTKTRTAKKKTETRAFPPKQFAHDGPDTCPVFAYKEYARQCAESMLTADLLSICK